MPQLLLFAQAYYFGNEFLYRTTAVNMAGNRHSLPIHRNRFMLEYITDNLIRIMFSKRVSFFNNANIWIKLHM